MSAAALRKLFKVNELWPLVRERVVSHKPFGMRSLPMKRRKCTPSKIGSRP